MTAFYAFAAILLLLVTVVVVSAVRERSLEPEDAEEAGPAARRDAALAALRELEFDRETDKLPEEEYRRLRDLHAREALRARDEVDAGAGRCAACGAERSPGDRFCARCGAEGGEAEVRLEAP